MDEKEFGKGLGTEDPKSGGCHPMVTALPGVFAGDVWPYFLVPWLLASSRLNVRGTEA